MVDLWLYRVACARYGGPIATIRDDRKMVLVSGSITQPLVKIYTSAGVQQAVFIWDKGRIEAMGWTSEEDLMIVEQTGEVTCNTCGLVPAKGSSGVLSRYVMESLHIAISFSVDGFEVLHSG